MLKTLRSGFGCSILLAVSLPVFGERPAGKIAGEEVKIVVRVYDYAEVPRTFLAGAKAEAARIYSKIGIEIEWLDCPLSAVEVDRYPACTSLSGPGLIALRILPKQMAERLSESQLDLGLALVGDKLPFPTSAYVFFNRVERRAKIRNCDLPTVLAHAMAHEVGHLLLGAGEHSATGIMRAEWNPRDLKRAERGALVFSSSQAEKMTADVRGRAESSAR